MANDKITYNEQLDWFQRTKAGRGYINASIDDYLIPQKQKVSREYRDIKSEKYEMIRSGQLVNYYHAYLDTLHYKRTDLWYKECSMEHVKKLLGNQDLAIDSDDISFVHVLAKMTNGKTDLVPYLPNIVDELEAVKALIEYNYGVQIPVVSLCEETTALKNALQMTKLKFKAQHGFDIDIRQHVGTPLGENFGKIPVGQRFDVDDFLPDRNLKKSTLDNVVGMLKDLVMGKENKTLRRYVYRR